MAGGFGIGKKERGDAAGACGGGKVFGIAPHADDQIEAGFGGGAAAGGVQRGPCSPSSSISPATRMRRPARARGERANHGAQRLGIGVVAVIQHCGAGDLDDLAALVAGGERFESAATAASRSTPASSATARPAMAFDALCAPSRCSVKVAFALAGAKADVQAVEIFSRGENLRIGAWAGAEVNNAARKIAAKLRDIGIVAIEESDAVGGQRGHQLELGARDAGLALGKIFNVRGADVGDDAPVGRGDARQRGNFAGVVHAHFDHGEFVLRLEAQQLQRQAEGVVQIALRLEDVELCAERGGDGFLGGGFAGRAGDGDDAFAPLAAHMRGQRLQGDERIFGNQERSGERGVGQRGDARARDHGGDRSALERGGDKVVAVEPLAAHGKEQLARRHGARVDGVAGRHKRARIGNAGGRLEHCAGAHRGFCQCEFHCFPP